MSPKRHLGVFKAKGDIMNRSTTREQQHKNSPVKTFIASFLGIVSGLPFAALLSMPLMSVSAQADNTSNADVFGTATTNVCGAPSVAPGGGLGGAGEAVPTLQTAVNSFTPGGLGGAGGAGGGGGGGGIQLPSITETASISNTGPNSSNNVTFNDTLTTTISNTNNVSVSNDNSQTATSGSATVSNNTSGGSALSGEATNTSSMDTDISISN